jgi:hypothetical protein
LSSFNWNVYDLINLNTQTLTRITWKSLRSFVYTSSRFKMVCWKVLL